MSGGNDEVDFALRLITNELEKNAATAARELEFLQSVMEKTGKTENEVKAAMKSLAAAAKEAGVEAARLASREEAAANKRAAALKHHADEHSSAMERVGTASSNAESQLASFALKGVAALAALAVGAGLAGEKFAIDAADFKTKTLIALETMDGSKGAAEKTLKLLREGSNTLGMPTDELTKMYTQLRDVGFQADETATIVSGAMDAAAGRNSPEAGQHVMEAITKIARTGKFDPKAVKEALRGIGTEDELAAALSHIGGTKGLGIAQIKSDMEHGKIAAGDGVNAILSVIQQKYDKGAGLGTKAAEVAEKTVGGQMQGLKNSVTDIFADAAVNGPFIDMLKSLNKLLGDDTESGQEIRRVLGEAFTAIGDAVAKIKPDDIEKTIKAAIKMADAAEGIAKAFGGSLGKNLDKVLGKLSGLFDDSEGGSAKLGLLTGVLEVLGAVVGRVGGTFIDTFLAVPLGLADLYTSLKNVFDRIPHSWDEVQKWWDGLSLEDVGTDLVKGLWDGIKAKWRWMLEKFTDLVDLLPAAVKTALGIASPSKIMMELGGFAGEGFTEGITGENDNARRAMLELVTPPPTSAVTTSTTTTGASVRVGGASFSIGELHIHVDGPSSGSPEDIAEAVHEVLRQHAREMGAIGEEEVA